MKVLFVLALSISYCRSQNVPRNFIVDSECLIPNQKGSEGVCVYRKNCPNYDNLFNVNDLSVERLSFIMNLNCGFDYSLWETLVCCPRAGRSYLYVLKNLTFKLNDLEVIY